jgi:DNA polymerase-1
VVRANMRQAGTETGRFSYSNPNLQNLPKEDEPEDLQKPYLVRGCFTPRAGMVYVAKDYEQQEYRLMLDYAGATKLIDAVMGGMDVHQATAQLVGVTRKQAKTLNFAILYGAGADTIAAQLGIPRIEAQHLKDKYFSRIPEVERLIWNVTMTGKQRGYVRNWFGRKCYIANPQWAYILPNHLIQGGCADVIKIAMNRIQAKIEEDKVPVYMLLNVHDELLFEMDPSYIGYVDEVITPIMEQVYTPKRGMKLTTSSSHSFKSYSAKDMVKGLEYERSQQNS